MRYEIDIFGVLAPSLLLWLVAAYALLALLRAGLERTGFYRAVWHPALFDLAVYVCLLGGIVYLSSEFLP
jgi:apolipoprotein N-acyltransferase